MHAGRRPRVSGRFAKGNAEVAPVVHLGPFGSENALGGIDDACIRSGYLKGIASNRSFVVKVATGG